MNLYVRFIHDQPNGVFTCKSFKAYEGVEVQVQVDQFSFENFPELVVELDNAETLHDVLDFEAV